ncbi:hypothetical protein [Gimesia fumaroli]|uniref:Carboxypeptidase regulatory-like domain-containing protein n=1 Tax=Gimesia fumaroli TaxID=2527976 RepID=A0A518IC39_9PLAN|nr:hypothetical protein [Gimesia fumaroli]QDV50672.1 hypothetical protein Enr17x_27140 [Gimesia fumaroli]
MITKIVSIKSSFSCFYSIRYSLFLGLVLLSCVGCSGAKDDPRGKRFSVSGLVYYDGDPIASARILFISETSEGKVKSAGIVREGIYQIPEKGGPVAGKARVEIYPTYPEMEEIAQLQAEAKKTGKPFVDPSSVKIPAAYNKNSKLTAKITKDGKNTFEFKIDSKSP